MERTKWEEWEAYADTKPQYLEDPFIEGKLIISDRRITFNSLIMPGEGEKIAERINFYNNKDPKYPIFLIIDRCSGGSVVEGAQILKAMQSSKAPIYVVVRSLAASMAAVLTALADRSFAYPNAVIVHHQISVFVFGNMTQQKERLKMTRAWSDRLMEPVAAKMNLNLDGFIERMYENNSDGNWQEFADGAQKQGWVDHVVKEVVDTSYIKLPMPEMEEEQMILLRHQEQTDEHGMAYMKLPRLGPGDLYFLYNPDNYYR